MEVGCVLKQFSDQNRASRRVVLHGTQLIMRRRRKADLWFRELPDLAVNGATTITPARSLMRMVVMAWRQPRAADATSFQDCSYDFCASTTAMAAILAMSPTAQPRCKTCTALRAPIRMGPMAVAPPKCVTSL